MKRTRFLLIIGMCLLSFFSTVNAEEVVKEKEPHRFGVGISYDFKNRIRREMHPIEFTIRYKLPERHTFYLNVPLGWRKWKDSYTVAGYDTHKMRLYGLGIGYDYTIAGCKHLELFAGGGLEYQRLNHRNQTISHEETKSVERSKFNDYAIYPKVGLRYTWRFVGAELDYRFYISERAMEGDYYGRNTFHGMSGYGAHSHHSFHCGVYFLF